jgi:phage I-like protein
MEKVMLNLLTPAMPPEWIKILPLGQVNLGDNRPPFFTELESLVNAAEYWRERKIDMVIDYEHQTLTGAEAPAAGWIKELDPRQDGLWARVEWTPNAYDRIMNREYRYISPVIELDKARYFTRLLNVALTNYPAINELSPLTLKKEMVKENDRVKGKLLEIFDLKTETEEGEILAAVKHGRQAVEFLEDLSELLGVKPNTSEIKGAVLALKASRDVIGRLQDEVDRLNSERALRQSEKALELALRAGKITPAMKNWALEYAKTDPAGFEIYVANAPKILPIGDNLPPHENLQANSDNTLAEYESKIIGMMRITPEQFKKSKEELENRANKE